MKNLRIRIIMALFATGALFWGCDSLIYDDLKDCPQGVYVKFYSKTPCADDSLFIGNVSSLIVFAFDQQDKLSTTVQQQNVNLSRDFEVLVPVSNGNYSFIAWAGINDKFKKQTFTPGVTTRQDVMMTINSTNNVAERLNKTERIWHGESPVVFLPNPEEYGSLYKHTAINLKELTNRVKIIIEFDKATMKTYDPSKLNVAVSSANSTVHIDGSMPMNTPVLTYPSIETKLEENTGSWYYSMLALKTGYSNKLNITYTGNDKEETVFDGDLIASILLRAVDKGVNLDCENDFTVKFLIKDYCAECWTHFSCSIYVNDWLVHSYSTDFEI
ncbi:MAG TPA: FimB/Mfa2 family fimbrial subunit [Dysgonomonas sp.]|uniref:FimB/Mfa2 family fimbrial subunit n=1 Tax=unclassified Dysgonomonas TaxID=2630389 RepID=UPI0025C59531|nr:MULTISPECIES: FimB/Mfa2 family fimbrial subunit [unclassified Dysgonomonas]HML66122.1 FimB/Mfa2 family fimbrial subunit [Dysgonomonas sp.]